MINDVIITIVHIVSEYNTINLERTPIKKRIAINLRIKSLLVALILDFTLDKLIEVNEIILPFVNAKIYLLNISSYLRSEKRNITELDRRRKMSLSDSFRFDKLITLRERATISSNTPKFLLIRDDSFLTLLSASAIFSGILDVMRRESIMSLNMSEIAI